MSSESIEYVHKRLDDAGVPTFDDGRECRIGARLDLLLGLWRHATETAGLVEGIEVAEPVVGEAMTRKEPLPDVMLLPVTEPEPLSKESLDRHFEEARKNLPNLDDATAAAVRKALADATDRMRETIKRERENAPQFGDVMSMRLDAPLPRNAVALEPTGKAPEVKPPTIVRLTAANIENAAQERYRSFANPDCDPPWFDADEKLKNQMRSVVRDTAAALFQHSGMTLEVAP